MPVHDWTRVEPVIFHDFQHGWIADLKHALNGGLLPSDYYALTEPNTSDTELEGPRLDRQIEADIYAAKANRIAVRHVSGHRVIAVIEIVSPGNERTRPALRTFVEKAAELLCGGVHLLVIDLFLSPHGDVPVPLDGTYQSAWQAVPAVWKEALES